MALMKGSAIVGQISGMVGGVEFASGKSGMTVKGKRRRRLHNTTREADRTWFLGLMQFAWRNTDDYTRSQWESYARSNPSTNRFGNAHYLSGFQACFSYHSLIYDWFDRPQLGGPLSLIPPQPKTVTTFEFTGWYVEFSVSRYYLATVPGPWGAWARVMCYASRMCSPRWTGSTNMRFIGSQATVSASYDWRAQFTRAGCDWELIAGERVHLHFIGLGGDGLGWPNSGVRGETIVVP